MAELIVAALPVIDGTVVLIVSLAVFALAAEWAINRIVRACGVYKLVVEFMIDRAKKRGPNAD